MIVRLLYLMFVRLARWMALLSALAGVKGLYCAKTLRMA